MKPIHHPVVAAAFMILFACSSAPQPDSLAAAAEPSAAPDRTSTQAVRFSPPPLVLTSDTGATAELQPVDYCWSGPDVALCADGDPWQFDQPELTGTGVLTLDWPLEGWAWTLSPRVFGGACGTALPVLENRVAGAPIAVPAGGDLVFVEGKGPEGDVTYAFVPRFSDPVVRGEQTTTLALAASSEPITASKLSVTVTNLAEEPDSVTAAAFVQGSQGRIVEFELVAGPPDECFTGSVIARPAESDPGPSLAGFVSPVEVWIDLIIDGVVHRSEPITWPDDFGAASAVSPALTFTPLDG